MNGVVNILMLSPWIIEHKSGFLARKSNNYGNEVGWPDINYYSRKLFKNQKSFVEFLTGNF